MSNYTQGIPGHMLHDETPKAELLTSHEAKVPLLQHTRSPSLIANVVIDSGVGLLPHPSLT